MIVAPIGIYFLTVESIFRGKNLISFHVYKTQGFHLHLYPCGDIPCIRRDGFIVDMKSRILTYSIGNSTWAAISAAVTANIILVAYIVVAWKDDQGERLAQEKKAQ